MFSDTLDAAAKSCESAVDIVLARIPAKIRPAISAGKTPWVERSPAVAENAKQLPGYLSFVSSYSETTGESEPYNLLHIITTLSWGLGYFGMPHILLRFMAIEDEKKLKLSRRVASVWVVIAMAMAVLIGIVGRRAYEAGLGAISDCAEASSPLTAFLDK